MKLHVGSQNQTKIQAVKDAVALYPQLFPTPEIVGIHVPVDLYGHPKNLRETIDGAITRAKNAFTDCVYSFGIEGGLMEVPYTKTGFMEVGACAIYDGKNIHLGLGPAFEWPTKITEMVLSDEADASQAFYKLGFTNHEKIGTQPGGIVGLFTEGRITREKFTQYSIIMALIQIENPQYFQTTV